MVNSMPIACKFSSGFKIFNKVEFEVEIAHASFKFKRNCLLKQNFEPFLKLHFF
nr:hypothetical protein [uncultured Campylobacter sp.]